MFFSVLSPLNPRNNSCGYCSPPGQRSEAKSNYHAADCISSQLSCQTYQTMIDRGWRRSGTHLYKPDLKRSCCPQYTIRLNSNQFKPYKSQRKLINRFNRFVICGDDRDSSSAAESSRAKGGKASQRTPVFELETAIHASETLSLQGQQLAHTFEVTIEPSSFTEEKFALYQLYQRDIHHEDEKQPESFKTFLVESPLISEDIPYPETPAQHLPHQYGSYHQLYRLDGKLIAIGVIDVLPSCVSSVYFMYDKTWERLSLGKLSALREIALSREIHAAGLPSMQYQYMGFYIQSCPKMRYKGNYSPSYLADPEDYTWHPLDKCQTLLDKHRYATFTNPEHAVTGEFIGPPHNPAVQWSDLEEVKVFMSSHNGKNKIIPVTSYSAMDSVDTERAVNTLVDGLGLPLAHAQDVVLWFRYVI